MLNTRIALFGNCQDKQPKAHPTIGAVLEAVRNPSSQVATICAQLRAEPDKARRREIKKGLPALCFGADLKTRDGDIPHDQRALSRSGLICLDFDGVADVEDAKARLSADRHVLAAFRSPSGDGVKVLVPIAGTWESIWRGLATHMDSVHGLKADEARKDVYGLCFASHDPALFVAQYPDAVEPFRQVVEEHVNEPVRTSFARDGVVVGDYRDANAAREPLMVLHPDLAYDQWIEVGQALHAQFEGGADGLLLWDEWSSRGQKYKGVKELNTHYKSFRGNGITFRSILRLAMLAGWTMPKRGRSDKPPKPSVTAAPTDGGEDPLLRRLSSQISGTYRMEGFPWPMLTQRAKSLLPGSVTLLCGAPDSAKSWFGLHCLRYWCEQDIKCAVMMLEEDTGWHLQRALAQLERSTSLLDDSAIRSSPGQTMSAWDRNKTTIDKMRDHLWCDADITMPACAEWVEKRCDEGCRCLIIDPITLADPGGEKPWDADRRFMARVKASITKTGTSLLLVTHPKKGASKIPGPPCMDDLAGGAAYTRAAASVLWMGPSTNNQENILDADGVIRLTRAHKVLRIIKARNAPTQGDTIVFTFDDLNLQEEGLIVKDEPKTQQESADRRRKSSAKPHPAEDKFNK